MKENFKDILGIEGVHGVIVLDGNGHLLLSRFSGDYREEESRIGSVHWNAFIPEFSDIVEAEFVFERRRLYVRKIQHGFFMVVLDVTILHVAMPTNCEVLQSSLDRLKPGGRFGQFFKKRRS